MAQLLSELSCSLGKKRKHRYKNPAVSLFHIFLTRLYDRKLPNPHPIPRPTSNLTYRIQTLVGITGVRMVKYRPGWKECAIIWFKIIWRPHLVGVLLFEVRYMLPLIWHLLSATLGYALRFQYWYQCTPFYYK
jgi:hypothetical protein